LVALGLGSTLPLVLPGNVLALLLAQGLLATFCFCLVVAITADPRT
jgi:hypothetical protein